MQQKLNVQPKVNVQQEKFQQKKQLNVQQDKQNLQQKNKLNVQQKNLNIQQKKFVGQPKKFVPKQNAQVYKFKMKGANHAFLNGQNYSVWHNNYRIRHNGRWRTFVALGLLAPLLIGANEYYPYAYIDMPGPYCEGLTEDGCELVYDEIETIEGDVIPQCVAYCPWQ